MTSPVDLTNRRIDKMKWLESCCFQTIEQAEKTLKNIRGTGLNTNFSINHDILKWAERVHRASYELWLLADIQKTIDTGKTPTISVVVEEDDGDD